MIYRHSILLQSFLFMLYCEASVFLIDLRFYLVKGEIVRALGGVVACTSLLGVPLGHNSSYHQGPIFAPPFIREAMWDDSTNSTTELGM